MIAVLSPKAQQLLDSTNPAALTTLNADGSPHTTPVWVMRDGTEILISTLASRQKTLNVNRDPRVSVVVHDVDNRMSYVTMTGSVVSVTLDENRELLNRLAHKYLGTRYPVEEGPERVRVVVRVRPDHVTGQ